MSLVFMCDKKYRLLALNFSVCVGSSMELCATRITNAKYLYHSKHKTGGRILPCILQSWISSAIRKLSLSHSVSLVEVVPLT